LAGRAPKHLCTGASRGTKAGRSVASAVATLILKGAHSARTPGSARQAGCGLCVAKLTGAARRSRGATGAERIGPWTLPLSGLSSLPTAVKCIAPKVARIRFEVTVRVLVRMHWCRGFSWLCFTELHQPGTRPCGTGMSSSPLLIHTTSSLRSAGIWRTVLSHFCATAR
jgi:hypothetical protein